ncbi:MAG: hypothetical protein QM749_17310 [Aquabacterium sp.]
MQTRSVCALWQRLRAWELRHVAVMGMTKNTGKTVCLNHLLAQAHGDDVAMGITSIGRDGEERDEVFAVPKPPVQVTPGCLVATARDTLVRARVRIKQLGTTGIDSPLGEIWIVKALEAGDMEVAGPSRSQDQHKVMALLRQCGASMVLLDGALGRSHHASPAIADGVVLATGAALGGGMADVLRKTRDRLAILGVTQAPVDVAGIVAPAFAQGGVGVWDRHGRCLFNEPIATLNAAQVLLGLQADVAIVAVSGAVGRMLWRAVTTLLARHPGLTLVVADGTKLFIDANDLAVFEREGGRLYALRGIRMVGITLNPFSPFGGGFDAQAFVHEARATLGGHLVTDVCLQEGS